MPRPQLFAAGALLAALCLAGCPDAVPTPPVPSGGAERPAAAEHAEPAATPDTPAAPPSQSEPPPSGDAPAAAAPTPPEVPAPPAAETPAAAAPPAAETAPASPPPTGAASVLPVLPDPYQVAFTPSLDAARAAEGWISLFDGQSLMGWRRHSDGADWRVENGVITASEGPIDLLCTAVPFADYELEVDFRMAPGGNSGLFLRTDDRPGKVDVDCYELNIADEHPQGYTTGALVGRQATAKPIVGSGGWRTFHVTAEGNHFTVYLDGDLVLDYTDESAAPRRSGLIGLQKNAGRIEFRNIHLKPLGMTPLFNGTDLSGWHVAPGGASEFTVKDGEIHVVNGRGFLESDGQWADFVFQGESRTNAPELNSGYFFRAPTIEDKGNCNGYEAQINNALLNGNRKQPKDFGTGAIHRRAKARYVVSSDEQWCTSTVIAFGPQICTWVDGYQVVDWVDDRPAADTARNGLFTAAGHIALQGHDPTTTLSFRNLRIAEVAAR